MIILFPYIHIGIGGKRRISQSILLIHLFEISSYTFCPMGFWYLHNGKKYAFFFPPVFTGILENIFTVFKMTTSEILDALWQMNTSTLEQMESGAYPVRDGVQDCSYYLRTGLCRFGATCRFNHPLYRRLAFATAIIKCGYPERIGEPECQFYLKTGTCKFGVTCKFHHPRDRAGIAERASLNVLGYPLRPGQVVPVSPLENLQKTAGNSQNDGMLHQGEGIYRGAQFDLNSLHYAFQRDDVFPERPGQPDCQFYMKTGDCKFGALCKFHHPREKFVPVPDCVLSPLGFPLRPGEPHCVFYSRYGVCKFGPSCKFDHPMRVFAYNGAAASSSTSASVVCNFVDSLPGAIGLSLSSDEVVEAGDKPSDDYLFDTE